MFTKMRAYEIDFPDNIEVGYFVMGTMLVVGLLCLGSFYRSAKEWRRFKAGLGPRPKWHKLRAKGKLDQGSNPFGTLLLGVVLTGLPLYFIWEQPRLYTQLKYDNKSITLQRSWPLREQEIPLNSVEQIYLKRHAGRSGVSARVIIRLHKGKEWRSVGKKWRELESDYLALQKRFIQWDSEGLLERKIPVSD